jgi:hypothetical protein
LAVVENRGQQEQALADAPEEGGSGKGATFTRVVDGEVLAVT